MELDDRTGLHAGFEFAHDATAPRSARTLVHRTMPDCPLRDDVELAASEMVSNVVCHTGGGGLIRLWQGHPTVRVEVEDYSSAMPAMSSAFTNERGRTGLGLVGMLSNAWGVIPCDHGKVIWAEFDATTADQLEHPPLAPTDRVDSPR
ncbi:MAG: rsbP6 [Ilumatobacteraceae bacterium]|nr:rsbP6 [Ilumatobacteraceae bacterium]